MKRKLNIISGLCLILTGFLFQSCIHEYPHVIKGPIPDKGENPTTVYASVDISFDLSWEEILHYLEVETKSTRARTERPHRFIIEILKNAEIEYHSVINLTPEEFGIGRFNHTISMPLETTSHEIAVWYDFQDEEGNYHFDADELNRVCLTDFSTTNVDTKQCAYASDILDLSLYSDTKEAGIVKELQLQHAGARFRIVATDIQQFILNQKEALNQGDKFTVFLTFSGGIHEAFNLYSGEVISGGNQEMSGWMRLPFDDYEELTIAEGFVFCPGENDLTATLSVKNSSLVTILQTEPFSFPIKQGYVTTIYGAFLSNPIDGIFSINNIWEGEIIIEI